MPAAVTARRRRTPCCARIQCHGNNNSSSSSSYNNSRLYRVQSFQEFTLKGHALIPVRAGEPNPVDLAGAKGKDSDTASIRIEKYTRTTIYPEGPQARPLPRRRATNSPPCLDRLNHCS